MGLQVFEALQGSVGPDLVPLSCFLAYNFNGSVSLYASPLVKPKVTGLVSYELGPLKL